jgi:ribosome-binding ATPase YchF (GTP1/OBG family)
LVPGAYQGRGRGNAFLNDLLDSDVLCHIVDASGTTDAGGAETPEGDVSPLDEVRWFVLG